MSNAPAASGAESTLARAAWSSYAWAWRFS
jgi:hypothetical protein